MKTHFDHEKLYVYQDTLFGKIRQAGAPEQQMDYDDEIESVQTRQRRRVF